MKRKKVQRVTAGVLAAVMLSTSGLSGFSVDSLAQLENLGKTDKLWSSTWHYYCIDHIGIAANGFGADNDVYQCFAPSAGLSSSETALIFWATLCMQAGFGNQDDITSIFNKINEGANAAGLEKLKYVTQDDLGRLLHVSSVRAKYLWLDKVVANADKYLQFAGLLGGSGGGAISGVPDVLSSHTSEQNPYSIDGNTMTIPFDPSGKDKDFIRTVPLKFYDGSGWSTQIPSGWSVEKKDTEIVFHNSDPNAKNLKVWFDTSGTQYGLGAGGQYSSPEDVYENSLELWLCTKCSGTHKYVAGGNVSLDMHQRCVFLTLPKTSQASFYAAIGTVPNTEEQKGSLEFKIYRHEEDWETNYNVQFYKYDHETGKTLEGSIFNLYERFDDQDQIADHDGYGLIYRGGEDPYLSYHKDDPVTWNDFRFVSSIRSDENGHGEQTINHAYHYEKTFCDGHPQPSLVEVPEAETDENGEVSNQDEIDAAEEENANLQAVWQECVDACEAYAEQYPGVHFHWLSDGGDAGDPGDDAGNDGEGGGSASGEEAFEKSGCQADAETTYSNFIALQYSYAFQEDQAREGYTRHGAHTDDLPIEIIRTDASENGANSEFTGEYSGNITASLSSRSSRTIEDQEKAVVIQHTPEEEETMEYQERKAFTIHSLTGELDGSEMEEATPANAAVATPTTVAQTKATPTESNLAEATPANAEEEQAEPAATPSNASRQIKWQATTDRAMDGISTYAEGTSDSNGEDLFDQAYEDALMDVPVGASVTPGPSDNYSHCNDKDGEGNAFRIYDHRTEGEIHINKRDMELQNGEHQNYDSYGDSQADATLEGAVYGLFAAENLVHPDGKTGTVYKAGNLVAVAATDKNGDASFLVNTEAPGYIYSYEHGAVQKTADGFADQAPGNLYVADIRYDDYTEDGQFEREYTDNKGVNGNCWIGRPLLLGDYYIKELTRSEGYELSVSNKNSDLTNRGQDLTTDQAAGTGTGSAFVSKNLFFELRPSKNPTGAFGDPDYNELFYYVRSFQTGANGFDVLLGNLPAGTKAYRPETGTKTVEIEVPFGDYLEFPVLDEAGNKIPVTVQNGEEGKYPKYQADGSMMTRDKVVNYTVRDAKLVTGDGLEHDRSDAALREAAGNLDEAQILEMLEKNFSTSEKNLLFVKAKLEAALRANKKRVPMDNGTYSTPENGVFDQGKHGTSVTYGSPVQKVAIAKTVNGQKVTVEDVLWALLDYYEENPYYNYGGLEAVDEQGNQYVFTVYASVSTKPANFAVKAPGGAVTIYHRVEYVPADQTQSPRYVYVPYSDVDAGAFGSFRDLTIRTNASGTEYASAILVPDSVVDGTGTVKAKTVKENVYYQPGEQPLDADGNPIWKTEWRQETRKETTTVEQKVWKEIPVREVDGKRYAHVEGTYTDQFGNVVSDEHETLEQELRLVVPERMIHLTAEDVAGDTSGWKIGDEVGAAAYYKIFKGAYVKAYRSIQDQEDHNGSYVKRQSLVYPGDLHPWQDGEGTPGSEGNTRKSPVGVQERIIKQTVKIVKDIDTVFQKQNGQTEGTATKLPNFRFKTYLKSNLQGLYRDQDGKITWLDKKGNVIDIAAMIQVYPGMVPRIHTKVLHEEQPIKKNSYDAVLANKQLYDYTDGLINESQNQGYTAVLEIITRTMEDGTGTRKVEVPNYEKFFAAIQVANKDKWDDAAPTYTSWKPIGNEANRTEETLENAKVSDMVRQFAIDWYLDDEVQKLTQKKADELVGKKETAYMDELTDRALREAIKKAENYLKPFFAYDLDEIYAVAWDSEADGGKDQDVTTLSADAEFGSQKDGYFYGISSYLPYGVYVVAEQQPQYDALEDFANKHYEIDQPKEVIVPSAYDSYVGSQASPEIMNGYYQYQADMTAAQMESRYHIRFQEESHVVTAHSYFGDFEVYKYGLDTDQIQDGNRFRLTQSQFRPYKNYYNDQDIRSEEKNEYYVSQNQSGRERVSAFYRYSSESEQAGTADQVPFDWEGTPTKENQAGTIYRDQVMAMQGSLTAYDGKYAAMLVPYTMAAPAGADTEENETRKEADGSSSGTGSAYGKLRNRFYTAKLRIEKLDSETHENILHDDAIFQIYKAKRQEKADGQGEVLFYEEDTTVEGSKEFLEAMGALNIRPVERNAADDSWWTRIKAFFLPGQAESESDTYTGRIPAGTPICEEAGQIVLGKDNGDPAAIYRSYSTILDGTMQTVGYVETPQPLGAGVYVIAEAKAPSGYVRTKPVAVEIYSDKVTYYKEGNKDKRILAAVYDQQQALTRNQNKPQDHLDVARIQVENAPIKLQVEKIKKQGSVTFQVGTRIEGSLIEIGGNPDLEYAYQNGQYLGYAYEKGTLESLKALKEAGEQIEIVYENGQFAGYGYITRTRDTDDDENRYVAGATMTLFDAIELTPSGDTQDHAFEGLEIRRSNSGNVLEMKVKEGYAGSKTELIKETDANGNDVLSEYLVGVDEDGNPVMKQGYTWMAAEVDRPDTDILYYDLHSLSLTWTENIDGRQILFGWDKNHQKKAVAQIESDKQNYDRTDADLSIYAFQGGQPVLEFVGGDLTKVSYDSRNKVLLGDYASLKFVNRIRDWKMGEGTVVYHLDRDGNRDSMVDPYTGMAYVLEAKTDAKGNYVADRVLVWPVNLAEDEDGNIISRDKITTSRIATVGEEQDGYEEHEILDVTNHSGKEIPEAERPSYDHLESGSITGSWKSEVGEQSHPETTLNQNQNKQNLNSEVVLNGNSGEFLKSMDPVYDEHGLVLYYQRSTETYEKGTALYDRNGDFVRYKDSDLLEEYNKAADSLLEHTDLYDGKENQEQQTQTRLYHRKGESYILENTWMTSDKTPNDPFHTEETAGQADVLKRLPVGTYILEELAVPKDSGYVKAMPKAVSVGETTDQKQVTVEDDLTKVLIRKQDAPKEERSDVRNMEQTVADGSFRKEGEVINETVSYGYGQVSGAELAWYPARYVVDLTRPEGYRLVKTSEKPLTFETSNSHAGKEETQEAVWTTQELPAYVEGIPAGYYIMEETETPQGFVTAEPVNVQVTSSGQVQMVAMKDDHTKVAIWKYTVKNGSQETLPGASFALYEAKLEADGSVSMKDGKPQYEASKMVDQWTALDAGEYTDGFTAAFEEMYREHGVHGTGFGWTAKTEPKNRTAVIVDIQKVDASDAGGMDQKYPNAAMIRVEIPETGKTVLVNARYDGKTLSYSYKLDYQKLAAVNGYANSWTDAEGRHRLDYLPVGGTYVLVETKAPTGFAQAVPKVIKIQNETYVQLYKVLNEQSTLLISKQFMTGSKEFAGNHLSLYRADADGNLTQTPEYLVESWISGTDGSYTEKDSINGLIPDGYVTGDLKPHGIYNLETGTYYLVETMAENYYAPFDPIRIDYQRDEQIQLVKAVNQVVKGKLVINKTDRQGDLLHGAVFELNALDTDGNQVAGFPRKVSDTNGVVTVTDLPVGEVQADGIVKPYTYKVREILAPEGYAINSSTFSFRFANGTGSYREDATVHLALQEITVVDDKTQVTIEKKNLTKMNDSGFDGAFIDGAVLALYPVSLEADGTYTYNEADLFERWTTSEKEGAHVLEGVTAGRTYVLVEEKAPAGYHLMKPILMTVSASGRTMECVSNTMTLVKVETIREDLENPDKDSISAVTVKGRSVLRTEVAVLDENGTEICRFTATGEKHGLTENDGIQDQKVYTFVEHTSYSDGSDRITGKVTRRIHFTDGQFQCQTREAQNTKLQITNSEGNILSAFQPENGDTEWNIANEVNPENPLVTIRNRNGKAGEALDFSQPVIYQVAYYNPTPKVQDIIITAQVGDTAEITDPYDGEVFGREIRWTISGVQPYSQGSVSFAGTVVDRSTLETTVKVATVVGTKKFETVKTVPVQQKNQLTVFYELVGSGKTLHQAEKAIFQIRMWDKRGMELAGSYRYSGSYTGVLKSGETVELAGNEYITVDPANFTDVAYQVICVDGDQEIKGMEEKGVIAQEGSHIAFRRTVTDTSDRQIFEKEKTYLLTEETGYSDGEVQISNRFSFTIGKDGGITGAGGYDQITKVTISKTDITTGEELPGNRLEVIDKDGNVIDSWTSGDKPHEIEGLKPGEDYTLRETNPKDGFGYAEDITFKVNEDGTVDQVVMENKPTHLVVSKVDITNGAELPGAHLTIMDLDGNEVESWISEDQPHEIIGKLIAGKTYILKEVIPADGYAIANEISFTISLDGSVDTVTMKDDTTKVEIHKHQYGTVIPVLGSVLQILNEDKTPALFNGKEIVITTAEEAARLEKVLIAGRTYWLHEMTPAPGYAYADDIRFTVSMDGTVDQVVMEDKPTDVILSKKEITGSEELPGNQMELIRKKDGIVVDSWISEKEPHRITGKLEADEEYILRETSPREGYSYAEDITFRVNHDGTPNYVEMRNDVTKAEILKIDAGSQKPLAGAVFELYDEQNQLVETWTSTQEAHQIYGTLIAGAEYRLHEVNAPAGYLKMQDVTFHMNLSAETFVLKAENQKRTTVKEKEYMIKLFKVDEEGNALPGATFKAFDEYGNRISAEKDHDGSTFRIFVRTPQIITVTEVSAPEGYQINEKEYQIRVLADGNAVLLNGDEEFYGDQEKGWIFYAVNKIPEKPSIPDIKKGKITAVYDWNIRNTGKYALIYGGSTIDLTTKTGDDFPYLILWILFGASVLGTIGAAYMMIRKKKKGINQILMILFMIGAVLFGCRKMELTSYAAEDVQYAERTYITDTEDPELQSPGFSDTMEVDGITYQLDSVDYETLSKRPIGKRAENIRITTSAPFTDEENNHIPEKQIQDDDVMYYLKSYETVETTLDAREEPVSDTITYRSIPVGSTIPKLAKISVQDSITGKDVDVYVPLKETTFSETHWESGFEFPITVSNYDANIFDLNGRDVPLSESEPLKGYESDLLQMIGVDEDNYQITEINWDGDAYEEQGVLFRKLKAEGLQRVYDCEAVYSGIANLPEVSAKAIQAVYTDQKDDEENLESQTYSYTIRATAKYKIPEEKKSFWERLIELITNPVVIAVLLILLFVIIVIWLIHRKRRKQEKEVIAVSDMNEE